MGNPALVTLGLALEWHMMFDTPGLICWLWHPSFQCIEEAQHTLHPRAYLVVVATQGPRDFPGADHVFDATGGWWKALDFSWKPAPMPAGMCYRKSQIQAVATPI